MLIRRRPALVAMILVFAGAAAMLALIQHQAALALPRQAAIRDAVESPVTTRALAGAPWDHLTVTGLDQRLARVSFFDHGRIVAQVAVTRGGSVVGGEGFVNRRVPYGDWIAYQPGLLIGLALLFALLAGVAPWRRLRNLDVAVGLTLVAPVVLLQHRYVDASVVSAVPGLAYLLIRCLFRALGASRPTAPSIPLLDALTPRWETGQRVRLLRVMLGAMVLIFAMVTISSAQAVDVLYAVMEGATKLTGGVLPYGHLSGDVVHGDTYPLLSFVLYMPLAWVAPVRSTWSSVDVALGATALAALAAAWALFRAVAGRRRSRSAPRPPEVEASGLRAALIWLTFPPVLAAVSSGTTDVMLALIVVLAVLLWRRPGLSTGLLAAGAWFKLAPLALLPTRLAPLRGRPLGRAVVALAVVSLPLLALLLVVGGSGGPAAMIHAVSYQFSRSSPQSIWSVLGLEWLQPVAQAATLAMIAGAAIQLRAEPSLQDDPARMAALSAAILIALQLVAEYWAFLYVLWVVPLLAVSLLAPAATVVAAETVRPRVGAPQPEVAVA
jgi:hypothetical protein